MKQLGNLGSLRSIKKASFLLFMLAAVLILLMAALPRAASIQLHPDPSLEVFAFHMPNQGLVPSSVYFSTFGSNDPGREAALKTAN